MLLSRSLKSTRISFSGRSQLSMTRVSSTVSVWSHTPRFSEMSASMSPIDSVGVWMVARIMGSSMESISEGSGRCSGLSTSMVSPSVLLTR